MRHYHETPVIFFYQTLFLLFLVFPSSSLLSPLSFSLSTLAWKKNISATCKCVDGCVAVIAHVPVQLAALINHGIDTSSGNADMLDLVAEAITLRTVVGETSGGFPFGIQIQTPSLKSQSSMPWRCSATSCKPQLVESVCVIYVCASAKAFIIMLISVTFIWKTL